MCTDTDARNKCNRSRETYQEKKMGQTEQGTFMEITCVQSSVACKTIRPTFESHFIYRFFGNFVHFTCEYGTVVHMRKFPNEPFAQHLAFASRSCESEIVMFYAKSNHS